MEHHSNQTSWIETIADWDIIQADKDGLVDLNHLREQLEKYKSRKLKIAAVTSCSNVTGIFTPYHQIAEIMHEYGGLCFVDFAASAPYIDINMNPDNEKQKLDAIYFSPHKFLGGPGSSGILVFDSKLYNNRIPDHPGGGTVSWTNPWGGHKYIEDIETREDGGTPAFLQTMKVALAVRLKEKMGVKKIIKRKEELLSIIWKRITKIQNLHILADNQHERLGVISFYIDGLHYNLAVKLLNDRYGIQVRGGCSCAGTYGHYLLRVSEEQSNTITKKIDSGDLSEKPGWIRLSLHQTMTNKEAKIIAGAIESIAKNHTKWKKDYVYIQRII
jgi:selenocysteine lyase/cysteine desulfurase